MCNFIMEREFSFCSSWEEQSKTCPAATEMPSFAGLTIVDITFVMDQRGRRKTGEAFVVFATPEMANQALLKHKEEIGSRYVAIGSMRGVVDIYF